MKSQSPELMCRLRGSLVQAILGDIDGFLNVLTDMRLQPTMLAQAATTSVPERQSVFIEPRVKDRPLMVEPTPV